MWVRYSSAVIPPLPTSSMSGSFQWPGPAKLREAGLAEADVRHAAYLSLMSPVVRHRLPPTSAPHFHTASSAVLAEAVDDGTAGAAQRVVHLLVCVDHDLAARFGRLAAFI